MKKSTSVKSKKTISVKNEQKITSFFNKLVVKTTNSQNTTSINDCNKKLCNDEKSIKISPNKAQIKPKRNSKSSTDVDKENSQSSQSQNEFEVQDEIRLSPDVIPCTPQEYSVKNIQNKRKLVIINDVLSPEKKKIRKSPNLKEDFTKTVLKDLKMNVSPLKGDDLSKITVKKSLSNCFIEKTIEKSPTKQKLIESIDFDDFFDDNWMEDLNENDLNLENWQYCKILQITRTSNNLIIKLQSIATKQETNCLIQGVWQYLNLQPNDKINIKALKNNEFEFPAKFVINNNGGFLVYMPNLLINPTSIVSSQFCKRRAVLAEKFKGFELENKVMVIGTLVHRLLQEVLKKHYYKINMINKILADILSSKEIVKLSFFNKIPIDDIKNDLESFIPKIIYFIDTYIKKSKSTTNLEDWKGSISSIEDIEENIWCTNLGIKGKIDVTIKNQLGCILPLELKTGRASMSLEHRGQVILYTMIMSELGFDVKSGLLLYLRENTLREVAASYKEQRDLLMLRNDFAYYLNQKPKLSETSVLNHPALPEPINHHNACSKCPYANICTAILSRDENYILDDNNPLKKISNETLEYLKPNHIDYFMHWTNLINLENSYKTPMKQMKHVWKLSPWQREKRGRAICCLKLSTRVLELNNLYIHTFIRQTDLDTLKLLSDKQLNNDFSQSGLTEGSYVIINTDNRISIASGYIKQINQTSVTVALERNLSERYLNKTFHLDTYESQHILNLGLTSLAALLEPNDRAKNLRELIIDRKLSTIGGKISKNVLRIGREILLGLNQIQQRAVLKALTVQDYLLIKGMPGTGKTSTIVALIQLLVLLNKSVLITSHTHSAVDNVCLKLTQNGVNILRLGSETRVHSELKHRTESVLTSNCKTVEELQEIYQKTNVLAVTCLAANHPILSQRTLDVCIVDESTQVLQFSVIKPLLSCKSFILIGDPDQLPPIVKNPDAIRLGMNESLFDRLHNLNSTITLTLQYRMNQTITDLANIITYKNELICANDQIKNATLVLPNFEEFQNKTDENWLIQILNCKLENAVIAVNTGQTWNLNKNNQNILLDDLKLAPNNYEEDQERNCENLCEAAVVVSIVLSLKESGISGDSIGVIAPYRAQVELLKKVLNKTDCVEINTVDQFQGRDKDIIIYSCTKSRDINKPKVKSFFEILDDKRRLTVAITRAKHKLIIIGDFQTLQYYEIFKTLLNSLHDYQQLLLENGSNGFTWQKTINRL